jgi:hypothetical protein
VVRKIVNIEITFLYQWRVEVELFRSVAYGGDADLILQFQLEMGDNVMKHCRKIKQRHRAHLDSIERKRDTARRCDDVGRRRGSIGEGKKGEDDISWVDMNLTGSKNEENSRS